MDSEATVIRAEMSQTRAELDRKLVQLEARAKEFTPRELSRRYVPEFFVDQVVGAFLTLVGVRLAWGEYRRRVNERERVRIALAPYPRWQ